MIKNLDMLHQGLQRSPRTSLAILELIVAEHGIQLKTLPDAQTRRIFEEWFRSIEDQVRTLVADLVDDIGIQQLRMYNMKQSLQAALEHPS